MRQGAVLAGGDDRRKRGVLGAELAHPLMGVEHDLALGPPHHAPIEDPPVDLVGEPGGLGDRPQLAGVLVAAKALHQAPGRHQLHALGDELLELAQALDAGLGVVVADPPAQPLRRGVEQLALGRRPLELRRHLALRRAPRSESRSRTARSSAPTIARPLVPLNPVSQRRFEIESGVGVSRAHEIAHQELVEPPLRAAGPPVARRGSRSSPRAPASASRAPRGSRRAPFPTRRR